MNDYFTSPTDIIGGTRARSAKINEIIAAIDAAFDNVYPGDLTNALSLKIIEMVADIALLGNAELPGQTGSANMFLSTNGSTSDWRSGTEVNKDATATLTAAECRNTIITNQGQSAEATFTLPTAAANLAFIYFNVETGNDTHFKAGASDKIVLDGTALDDGDKATLTSGVLGDWVTIMSFKSGASSYDWVATSGPATWTDGGA